MGIIAMTTRPPLTPSSSSSRSSRSSSLVLLMIFSIGPLSTGHSASDGPTVGNHRPVANTASRTTTYRGCVDRVGDVISAAADRIQFTIRQWAMLFERGRCRSVFGLAHDLLHLSQCSVHSAERWGGGGGGGGT